MSSEAEHGQMHVWEAWLKSTKLKLKQKGTGLAELLETENYKEESAGHSQQLTAAMMRCFEEGTRVWDIATTAIQEHGERADLVVAAIESEVGRGELFRAFRYTVEFFEDHWLRHDAPWGTGLAVTLSHLQLLRTRLNKEKLTVDQLMVLRVAFLLPERFSWLQREIFKSEHMTVEKLMEALKPHVMAGVLADSQSYKHKAVGAAGVTSDSNTTKKDSKALAAVTRQNRELSKEIAQLKQAQPERPTNSKGKGSKGKRGSYGKGGKGGKNNSSTLIVKCAHPQCNGDHFLKHCPKMQGIGSEEFRRQYKQYMDSLWQKKNTEKGAGQAAVELQQWVAAEPSNGKQTVDYNDMPNLVDDNADVDPETESGRGSVPGNAEAEPMLKSVPWAGSVDELFDRINLNDPVYHGNGDTGVGLVAGELKCYYLE